MNRVCLGCGGPVTTHSKTGRCRSCVWKVPEMAARRTVAIQRAFMADPEKRERHRQALAEANRRPERRAQSSEHARARRIWERGYAAMTPEVRARIGKTLSEKALAHIPLERREEYKKLVKEIGAAEAARIVLAHQEAVLRRGFA